MPDYTTLCRRQKTLTVQIRYRRADGPLNLLVDSTGIKFLGDGEWQARKHGVQGRRQWRKVHLAMDTATSDIRAVEFTPSRDGDSPVLPELLDQIPEVEEIGTVTADGAYDIRQILTVAGTALVAKGYVKASDIETLIGALRPSGPWRLQPCLACTMVGTPKAGKLARVFNIAYLEDANRRPPCPRPRQ